MFNRSPIGKLMYNESKIYQAADNVFISVSASLSIIRGNYIARSSNVSIRADASIKPAGTRGVTSTFDIFGPVTLFVSGTGYRTSDVFIHAKVYTEMDSGKMAVLKAGESLVTITTLIRAFPKWFSWESWPGVDTPWTIHPDDANGKWTDVAKEHQEWSNTDHDDGERWRLVGIENKEWIRR